MWRSNVASVLCSCGCYSSKTTQHGGPHALASRNRCTHNHIPLHVHLHTPNVRACVKRRHAHYFQTFDTHLSTCPVPVTHSSDILCTLSRMFSLFLYYMENCHALKHMFLDTVTHLHTGITHSFQRSCHWRHLRNSTSLCPHVPRSAHTWTSGQHLLTQLNRIRTAICHHDHSATVYFR